jgi:hypothetical protein
MWRKCLVLAAACLSLTLMMSGAVGSEKEKYIERFSARAMSLNSGSSETIRVDITITAWSSDEDRTKLRAAAEESSEAVTKALESLPEVGFVNLGKRRHSIRYTRQFPKDDGRTIMVGTYRILTASEVRGTNIGHSEDYTVGFAQLELNAKGKGEGTLTPAAQISYDAEKNKLSVEMLEVQPYRLLSVRTHVPKDKD